MYFNDHLPPHLHALYGEFNGVFNLNSAEILEGDLPLRAIKLIQEWLNDYKDELLKMWETKEFKKLPGLK